MIKKFICTVAGAVALTVTGKMVSDFAETKPSLKNVKDKLKKCTWTTYQVAKFYYDLNGNYIAWNDGIVF